jgi:hypothetical protein
MDRDFLRAGHGVGRPLAHFLGSPIQLGVLGRHLRILQPDVLGRAILIDDRSPDRLVASAEPSRPLLRLVHPEPALEGPSALLVRSHRFVLARRAVGRVVLERVLGSALAGGRDPAGVSLS